MKILFIEADKYLDTQQKEFEKKLKADGNSVCVICDCYNKPMMIKTALVDWIPDAIFIQTTFVYMDQIKTMIPLSKFITYPVELWYYGIYSATRIIEMLPQDKQLLFTGYDIGMLEYGNELLVDCWKRSCVEPIEKPLEAKQAFESYPELAESIQHAACHWKTDSTWSNHLQQINTVCAELHALQSNEYVRVQDVVGVLKSVMDSYSTNNLHFEKVVVENCLNKIKKLAGK